MRNAIQADDAAVALAVSAAITVSTVRLHRCENKLAGCLLEDLLLQGVHGELDAQVSGGSLSGLPDRSFL